MPALCKEFLDIQETIECGFTLKNLRELTRIYSQMHCTDKYLWLGLRDINEKYLKKNCCKITASSMESNKITGFVYARIWKKEIEPT